MNEDHQGKLKEDTNRIISEKMSKVYELIEECEKLAVESGVSFDFDHVYGMGGWFDGEKSEWIPSSQSC